MAIPSGLSWLAAEANRTTSSTDMYAPHDSIREANVKRVIKNSDLVFDRQPPITWWDLPLQLGLRDATRLIPFSLLTLAPLASLVQHRLQPFPGHAADLTIRLPDGG